VSVDTIDWNFFLASSITNDFSRPLIKFKPDWNEAEVTGARELDYYYESDRALGYLFRNKLDDSNEPSEGFPDTTPEQTPLLGDVTHGYSVYPAHLRQRKKKRKGSTAVFLREMRYVCMTHTLLDLPGVQLTEGEVVLGVVLGIILAKSTQPRLRKDRMRLHAETLVHDIRARIVPAEEG
jgi:RNA-dependent RNA polymerase